MFGKDNQILLKNSKNKDYTFRIHSQHYQNDGGLFCTFTIENLETLELRDIHAMELVNDMELLSEFSPQDILSIAYIAAQQNMWQEKNLHKKTFLKIT